jgi:hypothetical protein
MAIANMLNHMNNYYEELKAREGIDEDFHNVDKNSIVHKIEDVIRSIKPNCKAKNFKEYLRYEENQMRTQQWRSLTRQAQGELQYDNSQIQAKQLKVHELMKAL